MYKINFNHLHYFLTIAKEGSISKAAKVLHITQPALSHQLRILEEDLGIKLFDRVGKRLVINEHGDKVQDYANKIFRQSEEMMAYINSDHEEAVKVIKVGAVSWISKDQIHNFIKPLLFNQNIKVEVFHKSVEELLNDVESDLIDVALCDAPYSDRSKALSGHFISNDDIVCVAKGKEYFKGRFPKCLNNKKLVNYSQACLLGDYIDQFIRKNELDVQTVGSFDDISLISIAAQTGPIAAFLPKTVVKQALKSKELVTLGTLKNYKFSLWAITKKDIPNDGLLSELLKKATR